jgi:hypothetical protein
LKGKERIIGATNNQSRIFLSDNNIKERMFLSIFLMVDERERERELLLIASLLSLALQQQMTPFGFLRQQSEYWYCV